MFWHGRSYGHKTLFFIMMKMYVVWNRVWLTWGINMFNGMSATSNIFGLYYALFAVALTNYYVGLWHTLSHDVD